MGHPPPSIFALAPFSARPSRGPIFRSVRTGTGTLSTQTILWQGKVLSYKTSVHVISNASPRQSFMKCPCDFLSVVSVLPFMANNLNMMHSSGCNKFELRS